MRVLAACEESQIVTMAFRKLGHEAYSCDTEQCSGGHPEWHIQEDVLKVLKNDVISFGTTEWDIVIAFPPCTDLAVSGARYFAQKRKDGRQQKSIAFFEFFTNLKNKYVVIENPIGIMNRIYRKPDQIIQPWEFGHPESKATCLWLKGLPLLKPTKYADFTHYRCKCGNIFEAEYGKYGCCDRPAKPLWQNQTKSGQNKLAPSPQRAKLRSKTYPGIADAMASQFTAFIESKYSIDEWNDLHISEIKR